MTGQELRQKYLSFLEKNGHQIVPSASLVPENDPTTLFTSAGMQPMMPYLLGQTHPLGTRIVNSQKCFRSQDIEEVGDNRHTTFFEMLGNWSFGDYFKKEQITWLFTFLTKELNLPLEKLAVSVFEGNDQIPKDEEAANIWLELGISKDRIFYYGVSKNWWSRSGVPENMPTGEPGGPDSEVFFEFTDIEHDPKFGDLCHPNCDCGRFLEIGNSVFMKYQKQADGSFVDLPKNNIDFGGGLERMLAATYNDPDVFKTDLFAPIVEQIEKITQLKYSEHFEVMRIIADHLKASVFLIGDGVIPSNKAQGYVLRRLLRRAALKINSLKKDSSKELSSLVDPILEIYKDTYFQDNDLEQIKKEISDEIAKFAKTLIQGLKILNAHQEITGKVAFDLLSTYGFPFELTQEIATEQGLKIDQEEFKKEFESHQNLSRTASKGMFKGGLADHSEITTKYHTATHLIHQSLRQILGDHVQQVGSNITGERLRFDFVHPQALTPDELKKIEELVNEQINADLPVTKQENTFENAKKEGALAFFGERYPDRVTVYSIGSFSKEVCGGPHVEQTGLIGPIEIYKQESVGSGRRRLYARLKS